MCTMQLCRNEFLTGFQSPSVPSCVPLLQYADDTTFFIQGSWAAAHTLSTMMDIFSDFSGLQLNRAKSSFIGFGLSQEELAGCSRILATPIGTLPIRYLGVPLVDRRLRIQDWHPVIEKVETRLAGWRARLLSRGGRLVLLKAVLAAIPTYFMSIFRMPARVRRQLEQLMRGFFWLGSRPEESRGVALVAWETVCRPVDQGGLGVRQLLHTNTALLSKWVSRLLQPTGDLVTTVLRDEYGSKLDWQLWQTPRRGDSAFISSLRAVFHAVQPFFHPRLGSGESFRFWVDDWSGLGCLCQSFPRLFALSLDQEGSVDRAWHEAWAPALPEALSDQRAGDLLRLQELLADRQPSDMPDAWIWCEPLFSVRAVYKRLRDQMGPEDFAFLRRWRRIWKSCLPMKIRVFAWLLLRRRLLTRSRRWLLIPDALAECALCARAVEDCEHLFITCPFASSVWRGASVDRLELSSWEDFWRSIGDGPNRLIAEWQRIFAILWSIWCHRNEVIFRGRTPSVDAIQHDARGLDISWSRRGFGLSTIAPL